MNQTSNTIACEHREDVLKKQVEHQPLHLPVLYQDEHIIAIDKPPGLLVHRSPIDKHETVFAVQTLRDLIGQHVFPDLEVGKVGFCPGKYMASIMTN